MNNTDNKRLVKIIIDYTKTELPEQKIEDLVEILRRSSAIQDILFLNSIGIPIYKLLRKTMKMTFEEVHSAVISEKVSFDDIKKCILSLNRPTREYFESHYFCRPEPETETSKVSSGTVIINNEIETEKRKCGDCRHFKLDRGANVMGTCKKKLMTVVSNMFVSFKKQEGTCFEPLTTGVKIAPSNV